MNYLKKKINKHKTSTRGHDDDDVYDYIPAVPLHPSEILRQQQAEAAEFNGLSEEEIKERKEEKLRAVEEKARQKEEQKKGQEAWKFFEQLNQRVSDTVTKTQEVIETLKDSTTADDLTRQAELELGFAQPESDEEAQVEERGAKFTKGAWVGFDENFTAPDNNISRGGSKSSSRKSSLVNNTSRKTSLVKSIPIVPLVPITPVAAPIRTAAEDLEGRISAQSLLEDFGFSPATEPNTIITDNYVLTDGAQETGDDPFDTSYCDVTATPLENLSSSFDTRHLKSSEINNNDSKNNNSSSSPMSGPNPTSKTNSGSQGPKTSQDDLELPAGDPVPDLDFDPDIADLYLQQNQKLQVSRYGSSTSLASIMSNPFLNDADFADEYQAAVTPGSGRATPKRRMSTNPFEDDPEDDAPVGTEATAIAALTADFCSAIGSSEAEATTTAPSTDEPFDPFATITDDHQDDEEKVNRTSSSHLAPQAIPAYPSDVSDNEDMSDGKEREVPAAGSNETNTGDSAFMDTHETDVGRLDQEEVQSHDSRRESKSRVSQPFFDPFQPVEGDDENPSPTTSGGENRIPEESIVTSEGVVNDGFDDFMSTSQAEAKRTSEPDVTDTSDAARLSELTNHDASNIDDQITYGDSGFGAANDATDATMTDPLKDPFDTSDYSFEPVKDIVAVTDNSTFDAFSAKFEKTSGGAKDTPSSIDAFSSPLHKPRQTNEKEEVTPATTFDVFDPFSTAHVTKAISQTKSKVKPVKPPKPKKDGSESSSSDDDEPEPMKIVIRAKMRDPVKDGSANVPVPFLPPPPKTPIKSRTPEVYEEDEFDRLFNKPKKDSPIEPERPSSISDHSGNDWQPPALGESATTKRADSMDSPSTPLFDEDISLPLEEYPAKYEGDGWEMFIRYPAKKKLTGNRFWKKIFVRLSENSVLQLFNKLGDPDPFQELPLQPSYACSEISAQQYDQFGKIFTTKLEYVFYRERVGIRKGQIAKVIQGQITSFGSIAKLGMPLDHAPQFSELIKLGSHSYDDMKIFVQVVEEALFHLPLHRDRALTYKTEEIQITVQDEYYVEQNKQGIISKQLARVRIFFLAFINGMPGVEIGVNDMTRQGKEIVGRYDIIPVVTEEWIRLEDYAFHSCVMPEEFEKTRTIKLIPPDACYFELMRFRVRPPKNRELPLQVNCNLYVTKCKVEFRCEVLVPGAVSRKHGQIPCEDISIRIHIPECWVYFFRTEKHLRFGSVKSTNRRHGKIKGLERFLGAAQNLEPSLIEATAGVAKYEHVFHSLVWRIPRLPKEGQGAYTQQLLTVNLSLTSFDQVPESFYEYVHVEFTMPSTTVSHAVVRSVSVTSEEPPEKYVRNVSKHEYKVDMGIHFDYEEENQYLAAATTNHPNRNKPPLPPTPVAPAHKESDEEEDEDKDEDSD